MANPPPPYDDITGISRAVMKDNAQESIVNYNGNARPGEIVVDLTTNPPTPYIGNNIGQLTLLTSAGTYGNIQVGEYLAAAQVGNIIPSGNAVYTLGNATNQWSDLYVSNATIYLNNVPVGLTSANVLTVNGNAVLSNNSDVAITTTGNITAGYFVGNGSLLTGISGGGNASALVNGDNAFVLNSDGNVVFEGNVAGQGINRGLVWDYGANANGVNSMVRQDNDGLTVRAWTENGGGGTYAAPVNIVTNQDATENTWTFDGSGNVTLPGNLNIPTGNIVSNIVTPAFNSAITSINSTGNANVIITIASEIFEGPATGQVTISGVNPPVQVNNTWYYEAVEFDQFQLFNDQALTDPVDGSSWPGYVDGGTAVGIGAYGNLTVQGGNVTIGGNNNTWTFDNTGNLNLPLGGNLVGTTANNSGFIAWAGNSSGDGLGYTTMGLIPDDTLVNNDQYLVLDPTSPGHIHIRPGGTQDNSSAMLFLGGENSHFKVNSGPNPSLEATANSFSWTFGTDGTFTLPPSTGASSSQVNSVGNSSGDGNGYTTLQLKPDLNVGGDGYLIIDPTAPNHIHIRAGGAQDNSSAQLFLGGENSYFMVENGENPNVYVQSNSNQWKFDTTGILTLPGEGVLQSLNDTVTLSSLNTTTGNANSVYLGSSGGLGFNDQEIGGNWLEIFRNGAEPEIRVPVGLGNLNIQTAEGANAYNWTFDNTGVLTVPGNIIMPPGASLVGNGASPAPSISGFSSATFGANVTATGNISGGNLITTGNISGNTAGYAIGYRDIPQVSFTGNATIATTDAGKHFYSTQSSNFILTIANNASQSFQVGAAITIVNQGSGTITVAQDSGVTLYLAGNVTAGNRTVATFGMATIMKVATDTWFINGTGVS